MAATMPGALSPAGRLRDGPFAVLFRLLADPVFVAAPDGRLVDVNAAGARLLGYRREELVGRDALELIPPEWRDVVARALAAHAAGTAGRSSYRAAAVDRGGRRVPVEVASAPLGGGLVVAVVRDLGADRRAEVALRECEQRFGAAFGAAPIGVALCALADGRFLRVNPALCALTGYAADELLELTWRQLTHPDDVEADEKLRARLVAGELPRYSLEKRYVRRDGSPVWVHVTVTLLRGEQGEAIHSIVQVQELPEAARRAALAAGRRAPELSPREREVLAGLADGESSAALAARLGIGAETVQTHARRAGAKLGARTRTEAVALALRLGLLDDGARAA